MMTKGLALAASIIAFSTISGTVHAKIISHKQNKKVERLSSPLQMQRDPFDSFAAVSSNAPKRNPYAYHGGPKSND
jgi:hypothetical protein